MTTIPIMDGDVCDRWWRDPWRSWRSETAKAVVAGLMILVLLLAGVFGAPASPGFYLVAFGAFWRGVFWPCIQAGLLAREIAEDIDRAYLDSAAGSMQVQRC